MRRRSFAPWIAPTWARDKGLPCRSILRCCFAVLALWPRLAANERGLNELRARHSSACPDGPAAQPIASYGINEVKTEEGRLYLLVAIDRTSQFAEQQSPPVVEAHDR